MSAVGPVAGGGSLLVAWRLGGRRVVVVGGGPIAAERVRAVLGADGDVTLVAPSAVAELRARAARGELRWVPRRVREADLDGAEMVLVAVDDEAVGSWVSAGCRARRIPVSVADQPARCDFWFPAVLRDGPVQIAVSTGGNGPALARRLRDRIARALPADVGEAVQRFGALRQAVRAVVPDARRRMALLADAAARTSWSRMASLSVEDVLGQREVADPGRARIRLVGAGPGTRSC
ncbi:MAG: bifunctional precorrin-2 dehydrogenase/sirohydrochlorin ferrochelatase [Myxococcota bacterium]